MSSDQPLSQLELEAVEVIAAARGLADKLEAMLVTVLQSRMESEPTPQPVTPPKSDELVFRKAGTPPIINTPVHPNILQLADPKAVIAWDRTPASITELRNYAFMHIAAKSNGTVGFQYLTARNPKVNYMSKMDPKVYETLQEGKIYILHTTKKSGKNYWDNVIALNMPDSIILQRAKALSRFYGELMEKGEI